MWSRTASCGFVCFLAALAALRPAEARAQCLRGPGGVNRRMMNQMPGPMMPGQQMPQMPGQQMQQMPGQQMQQMQPPQNFQLMGLPPRLSMLEMAQQRQRQLSAVVEALEGVKTDRRLPSASRRRLQAVVASANKKLKRQDAMLTGIAERNDRGLLTATDQRRLSVLQSQQQALLQSLETYRQNAGELLARRDLLAAQAR